MHAVTNLSHRVLMLNYGRLIADATPDDVMRDRQVMESYLGAGTTGGWVHG